MLASKANSNGSAYSSHLTSGYTSPPPHHQRCRLNDEEVMYPLFVPLVVPGVVTDPTGNEAGGHPRTSAHVLWGSIYAVSSLSSRLRSNVNRYCSWGCRKLLSMGDERMGSPRGIVAGRMV